MAKDDAFVIVGASLAGSERRAGAARRRVRPGSVVLIGEEHEPPYERPPLSKDYLMGKSGKEKLYALPEQWYAENNVELRLGQTGDRDRPGAQEVALPTASTSRYSKLLLTTGSSPRKLTMPGADAEGVHYLRRDRRQRRDQVSDRVLVQDRRDRRRLDRARDRLGSPDGRRRGDGHRDGRTAVAAGARPRGRSGLR